MPKLTFYIWFPAGILFSLVTLLSFAETHTSTRMYVQQVPTTVPSDSTKKDTLPNIPRERKPSFFSRDRYGDPFSNRLLSSPLQLSNPKSIQLQTEADSSGNVTIYEKIGDLDYRPANSMTFDQFSQYQDRRMARDYWQSKTAAADGKSEVTARGLIPKIYISPIFDRIFGGNYIDFKTNGFVNLDFAGRFQKVANPNIPVRQQSVPLFDFDQQVSLNAIGQVGEKMKVMANFDTKASFQYEQNLKLDYTGFEEDIIQKIEAGNVSMPVNSTLITGAQNLFGLKTQLRFGRLSITGVAANQRASIDRVGVQGGVQTRRFELKVSEYEDNRHFFLSQFFRDNYERALRTIPTITSGAMITRIEVYVTNRNNNTQTLRNTVALLDLAETRENVYRPDFPVIGTPQSRGPASNEANGLFSNVITIPNIRQVDNAGSGLESRGLVRGTDFELLRSARRLAETEYTFHQQLGYISLNTPLRNDEILAVAYEYTYQGRKYKVGELMEDYQARNEDEVIVLKLLRPSTVRIDLPTWDLMMKNVYSLGNGQINKQGFQLRVIYKDDVTGIDNPSLQEGARTKDVPLVQVLKLDQLNPQGDPQIDGNFDFIEGTTVDSRYGRIIFPVLEPFGSHLQTYFNPATEGNLISKYVFNTLYESTKQEAQQIADKNKFFIKGSFQSSASNEFMLPAINADENSVVVTAGGVPLVNGQDYIVEGQRVRIVNESILSSGRPIDIQFEKNDLFNNQTRFLVGARAEYEVSKDFILGSTFMNLKERPLLRRVGLGNEPTNNSIFGLDANFRKESRILTALLDKLPLIQTKEPSTINISGEYARLSPGVAPLAQNNSFIDDFENAELPFDLGRTPHQTWALGATPRLFPEYNSTNRNNAYRRAKLAWYTVDPIFYRRGGPNFPGNISEADMTNHYIRKVNPQEIFRNRAAFIAQLNESIFDLAYFPEERGLYNYNPNLNTDGTLTNPTGNYGAISRAMTNDIDFDNANIQYIEFWMMDPFIQGERGRVLDGKYNYDGSQRKGGDLFINLGSISEDIMRDSRHAFENGLPVEENPVRTEIAENQWGRVTTKQFLNNAFENTAGSRARQDIGLDGLNSSTETTYFGDYLNQIPAGARQQIASDPSGDDFQYFLDPQFDSQDAKVLQRYRRFNGMEGNSPEADNSELIRSATTLPNNEDLNKDNTISDVEEYYQYRISIRRQDMEVGRNNIVDRVTTKVDGEDVNWYLFRIPIREGYEKVGNINGFKSIRFMRMVLTNFAEPTVLRMAQYQLVSNQWRQYEESMFDRGIQQPIERYDAKFTLSTVNIEENGLGTSTTSPYVIPPGMPRDQDITTLNNRQLNEQSLKMCVEDLRDRDSRAAFKNVTLDLINYKRLKMFLHAETADQNTRSGEVSAFLRLGTDYSENYYEIEVPLTISQPGYSDPAEVWPQENEIDVAFEDLINVKANRNRQNKSLVIPYAETLGDRYTIRVIGNPDLSAVQTLMIGVRNPTSSDQSPKTVCIWANELRSNGFDQEAGWAATGRISAKLADFATVTASIKHMTYGFGSIQQKISERARENTTLWDVSSNVNLDKLLPSSFGLKIPMFVSYERQNVKPRFNPLDPDMRLDVALDNLRDDRGQSRSSYRRLVEDNITRRSINFTNVQKVKINPEAKTHFYDIENLSFSYAYSDIQQSNILTEQYLQKTYRTGLAYNYTSDAKPIEPFKKLTFLSSPYLKWLQEFNFSLTPKSVTVRGDLDRSFTKTQLRSADLTTIGILPMYEKSFLFNRLYDVKWNLTRSLILDYSATANSVIDEPTGEINEDELRPGFTKRDSVLANLKSLGRMKNFSQRVTATYQIPLDKFPLTDFLNANIRYSAGYNWQAASQAAYDITLQEYQADSSLVRNFFGNTIQNNRQREIQGRIDLTRLYNKVKFLKNINTPPPAKPTTPPGQPQRQQTQAAQDTVKRPPELRALKSVVRMLMTARTINIQYGIEESTVLPGFLGNPRFFGLDSTFTYPGYDFILGSQDASVRKTLAEQGLLSRSPDLNEQFSQNFTENLNIRTALEPFQDFKIQLDAKRLKTIDYNEFYRAQVDEDSLTGIRTPIEVNGNPVYGSQNPVLMGNYSISILSIKTAFQKDNSLNESPVFNNFSDYLETIRTRLATMNKAEGSYSDKSQDVVIPAFIAAYTGKDPGKMKLSQFPAIPLPNWRVDYAGLSRLELLKNFFSSVNLTHSYTSNYTVRNFTSSLEYDSGVVSMNNGKINEQLPSLKSDSGTYVPVYVIDQVTITERFAPLIGINVRTQNKITARVEYNQERNILLQLSNIQVTEIQNKDLVIGLGFTRNNTRLPFKVNGKNTVLKNDLNFRCDFTLRSGRTIQRSIEEGSTVTAGNLGIQFKPAITYTVNQRLNLQMYFDRNINDPRISSSFKRSNTNFGVQLRYSLSQ